MRTADGIFKQLEEDYSSWIGARYGVAVNTGTAALHLALVGLEIGLGDEVIIPDFTMVACAYAVVYTGASPVFVDCGDDLNIDVTKIEQAITPNTKAIMAVHIYGRLADMKEINRIAKKHNLKVVEDACEAQGAKVGNADATCFSFYKNKIVHAEEGGMITTNNRSLYEKMQDLKNMAFGKAHNYLHTAIGFNYRMPDSQAQMALNSLKQAKENIKKRFEIQNWFNEFCPYVLMPNRDAVWVYDFIPSDKKKSAKRLKENGITYREFFKPMMAQPFFWGVRLNSKAQYYGDRGLYIPVYPDMTKSEVKKICKYL